MGADSDRWRRALVEYERQRTLTQTAGLDLRIGDAHLKLGERANAMVAYERAAAIYQRDGLLVKAVAVYGQLMQVAKGRVDCAERAEHYRAMTTELSGKLGLNAAEVVAMFPRSGAPRNSSSDADTHCDLGAIYVEMGLVADARSEFRHALAIEPAHQAARRRLALLDAEDPEDPDDPDDPDDPEAA